MNPLMHLCVIALEAGRRLDALNAVMHAVANASSVHVLHEAYRPAEPSALRELLV
jgi:hypothetical protein